MWADRNEDCNSRAMVIEWALPIHVLAILSMLGRTFKRTFYLDKYVSIFDTDGLPYALELQS